MSRTAEVEYLLDGLAQNIRNDGRRCDEARDMHVEFDVVPSANSSCRVSRVNETEVIVAIKAELSAPLVHSPSAGIVKFSCEFSSLTIEESSIEDIVNDYILSNFNREQLCVYDATLAWTLNIDCLVESSSGSLLDAIALALRLSLSSLVLPKVLVHPAEEAGERPRVSFDESTLEGVDISTVPLSLTLGLRGDRAFVDPSHLEEKVASSTDGLVVVFVKTDGVCCGVRKLGDAAVDAELLPGLISLAQNLVARIVL